MKGAIIGDIVGSIYEFDNIKTKDFPLFRGDCFFTDDTVMTVAVADALLDAADRGYFNNDDKVVALLTQAMQWYGKTYPGRGYGGSFARWIHEAEPQPYNSWGNGAPMRCSAAGWIASSSAEAIRLGRLTALPTHNHPEGILAAKLTALLIYYARTGASMDTLRSTAKQFYRIPQIDAVRPTYQFSESSQDTMPVALAAFLESTDFEDAIRNAISVGGDSDTIAAITGSIAEAYYGVPDYMWVRAQECLDDHLCDFVEDSYKGVVYRDRDR